MVFCNSWIHNAMQEEENHNGHKGKGHKGHPETIAGLPVGPKILKNFPFVVKFLNYS